jgi:hypothetical protein
MIPKSKSTDYGHTATRQGREYIDNGMNNSNMNFHHMRVAGDKKVLTILAGIIPIRRHISQHIQH